MASGEKVVRLSTKENLEMATNLSRDAQDMQIPHNSGRNVDKSRRSKRPEREIYRPGPVRHRGRHYSDSQDDEAPTDALHMAQQGCDEQTLKFVQSQLQELGLAQGTGIYDDSSDDKKKRGKRPDIQIYVPKGRQGGSGESPDEVEIASRVPPAQMGQFDRNVESPKPGSRKVDARDSSSPHIISDGKTSPAANRRVVNRSESPQAGRGRREQAQRGGRRGSQHGRGGHQGPQREHSGPPHPQHREAEDIGKFGKPPRQGGRQRSNQRSSEHKPLRKANSLDWDDDRSRTESYVRDDAPHGEARDRHGGKEHDSDNRSRRKRERRPSGQKDRHDKVNTNNGQDGGSKHHPENRQEPVPSLLDINVKRSTTMGSNNTHATDSANLMSSLDSQPKPRVTTDEKVEKSINKGTFQGLVFTNSRTRDSRTEGNDESDRDSTKERQTSASERKKQGQNHDREQQGSRNQQRNRQDTNRGKSTSTETKSEEPSSIENTTDDLLLGSRERSLTWDEQVEEEEKMQEEEHERLRISAVIQERQRHMDQKKDQPSHTSGGGGSGGGSGRRHTQRQDSDRSRDGDKESQGGRSGGKFKGRDRDRGKVKDGGKHGSHAPSEEKPNKNANLKVTFAGDSESRRVHVSQSDHSGDTPSRPDQTDSWRGDHSHHSSQGRGGLIKLPPSSTASTADSHHHHPKPQARHVPPHSQQNPARHDRGGIMAHRGQARGRGQTRGGSHRTLYDPNNPNKPTHISTSPKALNFYDPTEPAQNSPPQHQVPFFPDQYPGAMYPGDYPAPPKGYYDHGYGQQVGVGPPGSMYYNMPPQRMPSPQMVPQRPFDIHGYDQDTSRVSPSSRLKAENLLKNMGSLDSQLCALVSRGSCHPETLQKVQSLRKNLQELFEQVIHLDPELCNTHNVDQLVWKSAYYQVIELLRKQLGENENEDLKEMLTELLEEGTTFYENLLKNLQKTMNFNLEPFLDLNSPGPSNVGRMIKLALYLSQKAMIFLGDIARYKEQAHQTANYGKARNWYLKAQAVAPKNGRPYNQLAILAMYTRRKLDAVYYYMRSLAASNAFITARESLMSLFDEARKRAEVSEKKRLQEIAQRRKLREEHWKSTRGRKSSERGQRVEVWVSPDGSTSKDEVPDGDDEWDDLMKMSAVELNKRFVVSFLNVHGKLFTKIGMETFPEVSSQMLHEFNALLSHSPSPIGSSRLLQLVTINMFAIENAAPKGGEQLEENCRTLHQEQAVQLGLDMFGLLAERCKHLLQLHLQSGDIQILSEDLHCLVPSVKVWVDWMTCHEDRWNPPPLPRDPELGPKIDVWKAVAALCNMLRYVDISHVKLYSQRKEGCDPIILPEDASLAGFVPLLSLPQTDLYVHTTFDKDIARDCCRVEKLRTFADYLYGIENPLLSYNAETREYVSIAPESYSPESDGEKTSTNQDEDVIVEGEYDETPDHNTSLGSSGDEDHIKHLRAKKEQLERKVAEREKQQQSIRNVLDDTHQYSNRTELEICPQILVPDTNCFIDHLTGVQALLSSKKFTIVVPLVVINELDGLSKGSKDGHYQTMEHAEMVHSGAKEAVIFLETAFENRTSHLKALTSKGSVLETIAFRAEETTSEGNNDDLILSCCLHYCKDVARDFMPKNKNEPIKLYREVVLLTDDRNLRLKAHTRNVPVKDIPQFLRWAKIGPS